MTTQPPPTPPGTPGAPGQPGHPGEVPETGVTSVLLVDDDDLIRAGLRAIITAEDDLQVIGEARDGAEAVGLIRRLRPRVVLMDVRMPGVDGIQATRQLVATMGEQAPRILVVTTFENDDYVYGALRAGAAGFLLKRAGPEELLHAIRIAAHGDSLLFPAAIRTLAARQAPQPPRGPGPAGQLTSREADVLERMARGASNAEIAEALVVSLETVKTHVGNILAKLEARDRTQAVILAYESGFITPH